MTNNPVYRDLTEEAPPKRELPLAESDKLQSMTAFTKQEALENRLDWEILRDGGINLYWRCQYLEEDAGWFRQKNYQVISCRCDKWTSNDAMHTDFQSALSLPDYYGRTLDALNDVLDDIAVPDEGGMVVVFNRFDVYAKGAGAAATPRGPTEASVVLHIFARASRYFLLTGRRLLMLVQSDDPNIVFQNLAFSPVSWNRREFLSANRGI